MLKRFQNLREHIITPHNFRHATALILEAEICAARNRDQVDSWIRVVFLPTSFLSGAAIAQTRPASLEINADKS